MQKIDLKKLRDKLQDQEMLKSLDSFLIGETYVKVNEIVDWINDHENTFIKK
jgi:hypothetical protein